MLYPLLAPDYPMLHILSLGFISHRHTVLQRMQGPAAIGAKGVRRALQESHFPNAAPPEVLYINQGPKDNSSYNS